MKKFIEEFKSFALRGNMMDMAVGAFIATAFGALVTSLTDNFITPLISMVSGAALYGPAEWLQFGSNFVGSFVDFLIKAFVLFCILKAINKAMSLGHHEEAPAAPTTKVCPFCKSEIAIEATRCPHCTSEQPAVEETAAEA